MSWRLPAALLLGACRAPGPSPIPERTAIPSIAMPRPDLLLLLTERVWDDPLERDALLEAWPAHAQAPGTALAPSPSPYLSLAALLTGRHVSAIPICDALVAPDAWCASIPPETPTLPGVLSNYGYQTTLLTLDVPAAAYFGASFGYHEELGRMDELLDRARARWDESPNSPRLLVIVANAHGPEGRRVPLGLEQNLLRWSWENVRNVWRRQDRPEGPPGADALRAGRADRVSRARALGRSLGALPISLTHTAMERPRWAALGALTGTPHEALDTREGSDEGDWLIEAQLRVPLALSSPEPLPPISRIASLVDLMPTFLRAAEATPPVGITGHDLHDQSGDDDALSEFGDMLALREGRWRLTYRAYVHSGNALDTDIDITLLSEGGRHQRQCWLLHDMIEDPDQRRNLYDPESSVAQKMILRLRKQRQHTRRIGGRLDPRQLWSLRMTAREGYW